MKLVLLLGTDEETAGPVLEGGSGRFQSLTLGEGPVRDPDTVCKRQPLKSKPCA
jgi:hypothetical protein